MVERLLIDTHALLWWLSADRRLTPSALEAIETGSNVVHTSMASLWEIAIKHGLGKLGRSSSSVFETLPRLGVSLMPIERGHIEAAGALPHHHRDPFDRMMIAQAQVEGLTVVTHDEAFRPYGVAVLWT
jgi:PIN domain nuclease of toxin-antitoxin system